MMALAVIVACLSVGCASTEKDDSAEPATGGWEQNPDDFTFDNSVNPLRVYLGERESFPPPPFDVDIDFTILDGEGFADAYSDMLWADEDVIGTTLRVVGQYSGFYDEEDERYYHFVIMDTDLSGCCTRYFEFDFSAGNDPGAYPEEFTIIDVAGVYDEYYAGEYDWTFQHVVVDSISVLSGGDL